VHDDPRSGQQITKNRYKCAQNMNLGVFRWKISVEVIAEHRSGIFPEEKNITLV
jgi:hypothetical protein